MTTVGHTGRVTHTASVFVLLVFCVPWSVRAATGAELDALTCRGVQTPPGMLVREADRTALQISSGSDDSCAFIRERFSPGILKGAGARRLQGLNPSFEKCLQGLFKGAEKATGLKTVIYDGYRTTQDQQRAQKTAKIAATTGNSAHEYGLAVDIEDGDRDKRYKEYWKWIRANAGAYGLGVLTTEDGHIEARSAFCGVGKYVGKAPHLKQAAQSANKTASYVENPFSSASAGSQAYTAGQTYAGFMGTVNNFLGSTQTQQQEASSPASTDSYNELSRLADTAPQRSDQSANDSEWMAPKPVATQRIQVQAVSLRSDEMPVVTPASIGVSSPQYPNQGNTFQQDANNTMSEAPLSAWQKIQRLVSGAVGNLFSR